MNETAFKNKVVRHLKSKYPNIWFYKSSDRFTAGIPDIIGCIDGLFFALELKSKVGKLSALQRKIIQKIKDCGGIVGSADSIADVDYILDLQGRQK